MRRVVITGIGIVAPPGIGKDAFWSNIKEGKSFVSPITRFDASKYPSRIAGQVEDLTPHSIFSSRLLKKIDDFSHMALIAADQVLKDANLDLQKEDPHMTGVFMGNAIGGWLYAETELRDLYTGGAVEVSPYLASAWFPAAPQGQISIYYQIKGYSKTVIADRAGSLMAIGYAAKVIRKAKLDVALAGGTEAPVSPYALLCCNTSGHLTIRNHEPQKAYRPFDKTRDGFPIAEGCGILMLEELEHARKRGARIYAEVLGYGTSCDGADRIGCDTSGKDLARAVGGALEEGNLNPKDVDYICADGAATKDGDISETNGIKLALGERAKDIPVSAPKSMFGNLLGASGAVDLITTVLAMNNEFIPPTINYSQPDPGCDLDYVPNEGRSRKIRVALVHSRGRGGINTALAIRNAIK